MNPLHQRRRWVIVINKKRLGSEFNSFFLFFFCFCILVFENHRKKKKFNNPSILWRFNEAILSKTFTNVQLRLKSTTTKKKENKKKKQFSIIRVFFSIFTPKKKKEFEQIFKLVQAPPQPEELVIQVSTNTNTNTSNKTRKKNP